MGRRVQVVHDRDQLLSRKTVRVWDPEPSNLEFIWEPAANGLSSLAADGTISAGQGDVAHSRFRELRSKAIYRTMTAEC